MTNNRVDRNIPNEGEVAYFVKLHLDTLQLTGPHPVVQEHCLYSLEGKSRPMLVLMVLPERERGRRWLLVLPITSKGLDARGNRKSGLEPIGNCLESSRESFVETNVQKLPENMVCRTSNGQIHRVAPCDPQSFANAIKVVAWKAMKSK